TTLTFAGKSKTFPANDLEEPRRESSNDAQCADTAIKEPKCVLYGLFHIVRVTLPIGISAELRSANVKQLQQCLLIPSLCFSNETVRFPHNSSVLLSKRTHPEKTIRGIRKFRIKHRGIEKGPNSVTSSGEIAAGAGSWCGRSRTRA